MFIYVLGPESDVLMLKHVTVETPGLNKIVVLIN
jgi:hypothetical protein